MDHGGAFEALLPTEVEIGAEIRRSGGETSLGEMTLKSECTDVFTSLIGGVEVCDLEKMTMIDIDEAEAVKGHLFLVRGEEISGEFVTTVFTDARYLITKCLITKCLIAEVLVVKRFADQGICLLYRKCVECFLWGGGVKLASAAAAGVVTGGMDRHGMRGCAYWVSCTVGLPIEGVFSLSIFFGARVRSGNKKKPGWFFWVFSSISGILMFRRLCVF